MDVEAHEPGAGYSAAPVVGAVLATVFFPLIALIAALILQGGQTDPRKKSQLRTWAWASAAWMVVGSAIWIFLTTVTL